MLSRFKFQGYHLFSSLDQTFDKSLITTLKAIVDVLKTNRFVLLLNVYSFWSNRTLTLKYLEKRHNYTRSTAGRRQESV